MNACQTILKFYEGKGINILDCRGQCYDGARSMQSLKKVAACYILNEFPKAYSTHCCSHRLKLSLASSCKISIITKVVEIYKSVFTYFNTSRKRGNVLIHIVEQKRERDILFLSQEKVNVPRDLLHR